MVGGPPPATACLTILARGGVTMQDRGWKDRSRASPALVRRIRLQSAPDAILRPRRRSLWAKGDGLVRTKYVTYLLAPRAQEILAGGLFPRLERCSSAAPRPRRVAWTSPGPVRRLRESGRAAYRGRGGGDRGDTACAGIRYIVPYQRATDTHFLRRFFRRGQRRGLIRRQ